MRLLRFRFSVACVHLDVNVIVTKALSCVNAYVTDIHSASVSPE